MAKKTTLLDLPKSDLPYSGLNVCTLKHFVGERLREEEKSKRAEKRRQQTEQEEKERTGKKMTEVILHVYDVTNSASPKTNNTIVQINKIFKDRIGLGGIFHSAVQFAKRKAGNIQQELSSLGVIYGGVKKGGTWLRQWLSLGLVMSASNPLIVEEVQNDSRKNGTIIDYVGTGTRAKKATDFDSVPRTYLPVYGDEEWSFGFCEQGSGVFSCPPGKNPMYTYRESIVLGETNLPIFKVNQIVRELSREWPGDMYDLLARNCNHFCNEFCERLGVPKLPDSKGNLSDLKIFCAVLSALACRLIQIKEPKLEILEGWVNRFANAGDAAMEVAGNTALRLHLVSCTSANARFKQAKAEIVTASMVAYRYIAGVASNSSANSESPSNSNRAGSPRFQGTWFKNLISVGAKPSSSSENPDELQEAQQRHAGEQCNACLASTVSLEYGFLLEWGRCGAALESMETMELNALAAILDFICPLFGGGLLLAKIPSRKVAPVGTSSTLFAISPKCR
ncbi:hypothetical protein ACLOJK_032243 [Asimina triloba]